jgi:hypothetical protein
LDPPAGSFEVLENACRRDNDAVLISRCLETLVDEIEHLTVSTFGVAPRKLMRTAKVLGGVSYPLRREIVRTSLQHSVFTSDLSPASIKDACLRISASIGHKYVNPIPARLSSWCRGEIQLSSGSLERYQRVLARRILSTRLDVIEQSVLDRLKRGLPVETATRVDRHALRLLGSVRENRRGLRNFLHAWWAGNRGYLLNHPGSLVWYKKHNAVPRETWNRGLALQPEIGEFTIQVERGPLEILKLGTYFGTCLGIGGMCSDSAAAALLDVNKKVLYARDRSGRVVGRQLIALADDDRLVCFSVYPLSGSVTLKTAFRDYDREFARALAVPLYDPSSHDPGYEISCVLSVYWWDDYSWDFKTQ